MDWTAWLGLTAIFSVLILVVQRAERKRRWAVAMVMVLAAGLVHRYLLYRGWPAEGFWAIVAALLFNALFWAFIGRSNPPRSSDEIDVIGSE